MNALLQPSRAEEIFSFLIEVTQFCPLRCRHCFLGSMRETRAYLPWKRVEPYLNEARRRGLYILTITGGEPLTYPSLEDVLTWAVENDVLVRVYSSLFPLSKYHIEIFKNAPIYEVEASIYSHVPEEHDRFTGVKGSFEKLVKGAFSLKGAGIKVNLKFILHRGNVHSIPEVKKLASELGVKIYGSPVILPCRDGCGVPVEPVDEGELKWAFSEHAELFGGNQRKNELFPFCSVKSSVFVDSQGNVKRCMEHPVILGNILKDEPEGVFSSEKFWRAGKLGETLPSRCGNCQLLEWCRLCPGVVEQNQVSVVDMFCKISRIRKELAS